MLVIEFISGQKFIELKRDYTFYVYILTNPSKSVLYIGFTNNLTERLKQHKEKRGTERTFTGRYFANQLVYYEVYQYVNEAIAREKQLKKWSRSKKEWLINQKNPDWHSLNRDFHIGEE